ncbi:TKL protein kinase [Phytophthora nicotianae]|uniref:TKL protein kinase n=1 Tax=Phytophthora nicotianae TaxID=4792 RepID=W2N2P6_PHYNI|nr:TKL protein kinase [Phytophthora nicotianae]
MPHSQRTSRRWEEWSSSKHRPRRHRSEILGVLTPDRIGDHLVARCMALEDFRARNLTNVWLSEVLGGPRMSHRSRQVLQGIIDAVSDQVEAVIAYENESNVLVQLAQTGYIVQHILKINRLLDVALEMYGIKESHSMIEWQTIFRQERQERMTRFQKIVANKNLLMQMLGDQQQQLQILTLLVYDIQKHGDETFTDLEYSVIIDVYHACVKLSGLTVVTVPEWFVPAHETRENLWQGTKVDVECLTQSEESCIRQVSAWWDLHQPHVAKLFGACHVGNDLFLVHESAQNVKNSVVSQDIQLGTVHIRQFLDERKFGRLFSTENERKVVRPGGELLSSRVTSPSVNLKKQQRNASPALTLCPAFSKHKEWGLLKETCADDIIIHDAGNAMKQLHSNKPRRRFWNRKVHQSTKNASSIVRYSQSYDPKLNLSVERLFEETTDKVWAIERTASSIVGLSRQSPKWFIPRYEVEIGSRISAGSFGAVHHGKWLNASVAVKCLFRSDRKLFLREANIWFSLNHPNVIKLYGACHVGKTSTRSLDEPVNRTEQRPFFVCEYASEGTLNEYLKKWEVEHKSRSDAWRCLCEAARGLQYLHERGIIHGDLKGNNILVSSDHQVKLTDFGLSTLAKQLNWTGNTGTVGAIRWKAPERLGGHDRGPSFASDVYSFGMCIIEAVTGTFPWSEFMDEDLVVSEVTQGKLPPRPEAFNNEMWDLVARMCCQNPADRITISTAVALLD